MLMFCPTSLRHFRRVNNKQLIPVRRCSTATISEEEQDRIDREKREARAKYDY